VATQALLRHGKRRADGNGGDDLSLLPRVHRAERSVQSLLRRQQHRDAADRRHDELGRAGDRRGASRLGAANRAGHYFIGVEPADRWRPAGGIRYARAERHHGLGRRVATEETPMTESLNSPLLEVSGVTKRFGGFTAL